ncbi:hypothetical protein ACIQ4Z_18755 [Peribacillus asahii]|uniref:hypothetical protein n=1 Tax=Peribacillus asahii TaxID=228899 RepID=UPI0037F8A20E
MKKWMFSAVLYLVVVVAGYAVYEAAFGVNKGAEHDASKNVAEQKIEEHNSHANAGTEKQHEENNHEHGETTSKENEIQATIEERNKQLFLTLKDDSGNPVTDLEINHEKLLHLIVVDEHLEQYYHLHPEEITPGQFKVTSELKEGTYKAFVDIKSTSLQYEVQPIPFIVGNPATSEHAHSSLQVDEELTKKVDENKVSLMTTDLTANEPVTLTFDVYEAVLEPYLGAIGHVVILDEQAEEYLHVHPLNEHDPIFETQFPHPGIYKIWAEFQQDGKVTVYPFVVRVE